DRLAADVERLAEVVPAGGVLGEPAGEQLPVVAHVRTLGDPGRQVVPAVEVETDRLGVERLAVVEPHSLAQVEGPDSAGLVRLPAFGQAADQVDRSGLERHEGLEDLTGEPGGDAVAGERGIEGLDLTFGAED